MKGLIEKIKNILNSKNGKDYNFYLLVFVSLILSSYIFFMNLDKSIAGVIASILLCLLIVLIVLDFRKDIEPTKPIEKEDEEPLEINDEEANDEDDLNDELFKE